jgi:hypothetical protein
VIDTLCDKAFLACVIGILRCVIQVITPSGKWEVFKKYQYYALKTLNFMRKLNKMKKKTIWLKTSHFREGKRKLPALSGKFIKYLNYFLQLN